MEQRIKDMVEGTLVADAYCLGSHWVYDEKKLASLEVDWNQLNPPKSQWHPNRSTGEFTHYGDQLAILYDFVKGADAFDVKGYTKTWFFAMREYDGYVDSATRNTMANIKTGANLPCGAASDDLSIAGRIAPILAFAEDETDFMEKVDLFTRLTHYTEMARATSEFAARVLWRLQEGDPIVDAIFEVAPTSHKRIRAMVTAARESKKKTTFEAIRGFGPACDVESGLPGTLHLLFKYGNDYRTAMVENAKAGGDNSARAMLAAMLMVADHDISIVPQEWRDEMKYKVK